MRIRKSGTLMYYWWECKIGQQLWNIVWQFFKKPNIYLSDYPAIPRLGIYHENESLYPYKDVYINAPKSYMCNSQRLEATQMPINQWVNEQILVHPHSGIYSTTKRNGLLIYTTTRINLKIIVLTDETRQRKCTYSIITFI